MENLNNYIEEIDKDDMLLEDYSIDKHSLDDSDLSSSDLDISSIVSVNNFFQSVKEDNIEFVDKFLSANEKNKSCI